jgi:Raf kinase inhibitor-like YbhB/YbcL family protein
MGKRRKRIDRESAAPDQSRRDDATGVVAGAVDGSGLNAVSDEEAESELRIELDDADLEEIGPASNLTLVSASFADGEALPLPHTGDGANVSPPLAWTGVPPETGSLVLVFEGPDPTGRPDGTFAHWVLYNLRPSLEGLDLAADQTGLPHGCRRGRNDFGRRHYIGPLLDYGRHQYRFRLFALDATVDASAVGEPTWDELMTAMEDHVLAEAELSCFVERSAAYQPTVPS